MAKGLYGAYRAAGKAGGAYKASLYDIENVGYQKEHSRQMYEIGEQKRERVVGAITEGISLASNIYGGIQAKKERAAEIESLGKSEYEAGLKEGDVNKWEELSSEERAGHMPEQTYGETKLWDLLRGKADIDTGKGETKLGEAGERLSVLFGGERKYDWQGKDWTESELSVKAKLTRASERGLPTEIGGKQVQPLEGEDDILDQSDDLESKFTQKAVGVGGFTEDATADYWERAKAAGAGGTGGVPTTEPTSIGDDPITAFGNVADETRSQSRANKMLEAGYKLPPTLGGSLSW